METRPKSSRVGTRRSAGGLQKLEASKRRGKRLSKNDAIVFSLSDGLYILAIETGEIKRYLTDTDEWEYVGSLLFENENITVLHADMIKDVARDGDNMYFLLTSSEITVLLQLDLSIGVCSILPETQFDAIESYALDMLLVNLDGNFMFMILTRKY